MEPMTDNSRDNEVSWYFEVEGDRILFNIKVNGSVGIEFAQKAIEDAAIRKTQAVISGDAISLDLLLASLKKEAINDFRQVLNHHNKEK